MNKKVEIYEKALELFIAEGYDHTPLSRIAKALNLTKAGLYHYFHSKEELLFFIHEHNLKKDFLPIIDEKNALLIFSAITPKRSSPKMQPQKYSFMKSINWSPNIATKLGKPGVGRLT